jgi:hypothetical protein
MKTSRALTFFLTENAWTIGASAIRWIALACTISLVGCQLRREVAILAHDLLLPLEQLPASWEMGGTPRPMGPRIGFGNEDDSYVSFKPQSADTNAFNYVLYYRTLKAAEAAYDELLLSEFNSNSIAVDQPWKPLPELSQVSMEADQFRTACTINNIAGPQQVCKVIARYGQYIAIFHSVIGPDYMSHQQFENLLQALDETMVRGLDD